MKKNLKKFFAVALAVAMVAAQLVVPAFAVSAGDKAYCNTCGTNGKVGKYLRTVDPTCSTAGYDIYECEYVKSNKNCEGTIAIKSADPNGQHVADGVVVPADPSTCTDDGNYEYETCAVCEKAYLINGVWEDSYVDEADGHNYIPSVTPENCLDKGYTTYTCDVCGDSYDDDEVPAHGHKWIDVPAKTPTCKETGYDAYQTCEVCGIENPEMPYNELPVAMDHNLHLVEAESLAPTCTVDGYWHFECDEPTCKYYSGNGGIDETITAKHTLVAFKAVPATCLDAGMKAHKKCSVCDQFFASTTSDTNNKAAKPVAEASLVIAALGHQNHAFGYLAPTCTEYGYTDGVKCDRCDEVLVGMNPVEPTGHTLQIVTAQEIKCGKTVFAVDHKYCTVCKQRFDLTTSDTDNVDAEPVETATLQVTRQHNLITRIALDGGCIAADILVDTCTYENCDYVVSYEDKVAANIPGHKFDDTEKVEPDCVNTGLEAYRTCTECGYNFAEDADVMSDEYVDLNDLVIDALGHNYIEVQAQNPTYNAKGHTAGEACDREGCTDRPNPQNPSYELPELRETINFKYTVEGVAGAADAVNSGYVTLKIYFDVLADAADLEEYESDVLANIYAIDFALSFNDDVFNLTDVTVAPGLFEAAAFTKLADDMGGYVKIVQDMAAETEGKEFRGEDNLFATLTFQVEDDAVVGDYDFVLDELVVVHPEEETYNETSEDNIITVETPVVVIAVKLLGDVNGDGKYNSSDTLKLSQTLKDLTAEYNTVMDMDKDGVITNADMVLLRAAAAGNYDYKDIHVDPNAPVEAA